MSIESSPRQPNAFSHLRAVDTIVDGLRQGGEFAEEAKQILLAMDPSKLADLLEMAHHDGMTGLYNRHMFAQTINNILENPNPAEHWRIITMDMVNFKAAVNDKRGQFLGDSVLTLGALGLKAALRYGRSQNYTSQEITAHSEEQQVDGTLLVNIAGRIGGDENAALLQGKNVRDISRQRVLDIALQTLIYPPLRDRIAQEGIDGLGIRVATAMLDPTKHNTFEDVLQAADPKLHSIGVYSLVNRGGVLRAVEGYLPMPRSSK